jgi:hypothetical protein
MRTRSKVMIEYVTRFLNMIVAGLLAHAARLTKLAAVQHEVAEYTAALDEADVLENTGVPAKRQLAKLLRLEIEQTLETALTTTASPTEPAALNGDGLINNKHPFALSGPAPVAAVSGTSEAPAAATKEPAKRRRRKASNGRKGKRETKREVAAEMIDSTMLTGD